MKHLRLIMQVFQLQSFFQTTNCGLLLFCILSLSMNAKVTESLTVSEIYITTTPPIATTRPPTLSSSISSFISNSRTIPPFIPFPLMSNAAKNSKGDKFHNSSVTFSTSVSSSSSSSSSSLSRLASKIKFVDIPLTQSNNSKNDKTNTSDQSGSGSDSGSGSGSDLRPKRQLFREDIPHHRPLSGNHYAHIHGFPLPGRFSNNPNDPKSGVNNEPVEGDPSLNSNQLTGLGHGVDNGNLNVNGHAEGEEEYDPNLHTIVHNHHHHLAPVHINHGHGGGGGGETGPGAVHNPGTTTTEFKNEIIHQYPVEVSQYLQLDHDIKSVHPHTASALEQVPAPVFPQSNQNPHAAEHPVELDVKIPLYNEAIHGPDPDEPSIGIDIEKEPSVDGNPQSYGHHHSYGSVPYVYAHQHQHQQQQYQQHLQLHPHFHRRPSKFLHLLKTWPLILQKTMRHRRPRPIWPLFRATSFRTKIKHPHPPHYYAKY